jgi:signal transduction histidine kinase
MGLQPARESSDISALGVLCDPEGRVVRVLWDDLGGAADLEPECPLSQLAAPGGLEKMLGFLTTVQLRGTSFDWPLNVVVGGRVEALHFAGVGDAEHLMVVAGRDSEALLRSYATLAHTASACPASLRPLLLAQLARSRAALGEGAEVYDDFSRLNNELVTLQRELARKNAELTRLNVQKDRFLGMAAHDLRNPLHAIMSYSEFLLEEADDVLSAEHLEFLRIIRDSSDFMLALVNDLLSVSTIAAGQLRLDLRSVDVLALLRRNVKLNGILAQKKGISLTLQHPGALPSMVLDPSKIEQVLHNLISNALKFAPSGSSVEVRATAQAGELRFSVADNGPGIPQEEQARLFELYGRTSVQAADGTRSTGLGLAITKNIVTQHRGRIWVDSAPGQGTTVHVALPVLGWDDIECGEVAYE